MKQSQLFTKTKREAPKDEEAINAQLLIRAGYVDKLIAGVYTFLPLGIKVLKKIENIIREGMNGLGAQEILMPSLQPKQNWETTERWNTLDCLIKFTTFYTKNDYALGPTHEEIVAPLAKKFILSYKDLPTAVFQIQTKFRDEKRAKSGLLRGREFLMKDLYSFHCNQEDLEKYYEKAQKAYENIFEKLGLKEKTYLTYASGGTFSKYSLEYQTLSENGEGIIFVCDKCKTAINKEIINEKSDCPECGNKNLKEEKAIEVGNIFKLGTKYSKPFELTYKDESGKEQDVIMGCYGMGPSRIMGALVEIFHDDKGIIWPESVAPFKVHLLKLTTNQPKADPPLADNRQLITFADKVYENLQKAGGEVLYDDREDVTAGEKFNDADLIGIPYRAVISDRTRDKIELKRRDSKDIKLVTEKEFTKIINS